VHLSGLCSYPVCSCPVSTVTTCNDKLFCSSAISTYGGVAAMCYVTSVVDTSKTFTINVDYEHLSRLQL
jgi:hypothetical protein